MRDLTKHIDDRREMTRRRFGAITGSLAASVLFGDACRLDGEAAQGSAARLTARPNGQTTTSAAGEQRLDVDGGSSRGAILQMPSKRAPGPLPLMVFLHGAGGGAQRLLQRFGKAGDEAGVAVLAPDSRGPTWDAIRGGFRSGCRVHQSRARARVRHGCRPSGAFGRRRILRRRDLRLAPRPHQRRSLPARVVANSPGFIVEGEAHGKPRLFFSHGTSDDILPIHCCSRRTPPGAAPARVRRDLPRIRRRSRDAAGDCERGHGAASAAQERRARRSPTGSSRWRPRSPPGALHRARWTFERKLDGIRLLAFKNGSDVRCCRATACR